MARTICIVSGKGGVGKTTSAISIGHALSKHKQVIVVDANLTTPNVGIQLGWPILKRSLMQVLNEGMPAHEAIYTHESGLKILPTITTVRDLKKLKYERLRHLAMELHQHAEIVILDSAAGLGQEAVHTMDACDEILIITNPELPAVLDAQKAVQVAHELGKAVVGAVLTKTGASRHELNPTEVEKLLGIPLIAIIPYDNNVKKAQALKSPVTHTYPRSRASRGYREVAGRLLGNKYMESVEKKDSLYKYVLRRLGFR